MALLIDPPTCQDVYSLETTLRLNDKSFNLFFHSQDTPLYNSSEALVCATLLPAMKYKVGFIRTPFKPDTLFLENLEKIQSIFKTWKPSYEHVRIEWNQPQNHSIKTGSRVGLFFAAGVDSFYSLYKNLDQITDLIYISGFDPSSGSSHLQKKHLEDVHQVAASLGLGVVEINTNLRDFVEPAVYWGLSHGVALASVGYLLSESFKKFFIASGRSYVNLIPWGTHPDLDPLWSNQTIEFVHDGAEVNRSQKVAMIAHQPLVQQKLHVCRLNTADGMNCGLCEKCVRTMISLRAVGALDKYQTFANPLTNQSIYRHYLFKSRMRHYVEHSLDIAKQTGADPDLIKILSRILDMPSFPGWRKILAKMGLKRPGGSAKRRLSS